MKTRHDIRLAGVPFGESCHACAFFHSQDELYQVLASFIREGIEEGDKAFHIIDPGQRVEHMQRLQDFGIPAENALQSGQLEVRGWYDAYLLEHRFNMGAMLSLIQEVLNRGREQGYPITRLIANMEWALEGCPGANDLLEYEARLNYVLPKYHDPVICTYDCSRFSADIVVDMLRTHPMVVVGGILHQNPFYIPPDEFLLELRRRNGQSASSDRVQPAIASGRA